MKKLSRDEVTEYVKKIRYGMGDDQEVSSWLSMISDSVPNREIV